MRYNRLGPQGASAVAEGLKGNTTLTSLKCTCCQIRKVAGLADQCQQPLTVVGQVNPPALFGSLAENMLCCDEDGEYTAEGINALCEGLKGSAVISLKCDAPAIHSRPTSVSSR